MFLSGFICGLAAGAILVAAPRVWKVHKGLSELTGRAQWLNTLSFLGCAAIAWVEQHVRQSVKFDGEKKVFILSFFLKGKLHQLMVRPARGPGSDRASDVVERQAAALARGYGALISYDKWTML